MKKTLSLDVGITTGYAVIREEDSKVLAYGDLSLPTFYPQLRQVILQHLPSHSVVEFPLIEGRGKLARDLEAVSQLVRVLLDRQYDEITPSEWKSHPLAKTPCPRGTSPHVKDAIRLGLVYIKIRLQGSR